MVLFLFAARFLFRSNYFDPSRSFTNFLLYLYEGHQCHNLRVSSREGDGKWSGLFGLFQGLVTIPAPILGGLIWDYLNPMYAFLIPIGVDLLFKFPLLATVPETLHDSPDESQIENSGVKGV